MIGEIRKAILPYYDLKAGKMMFKSRPALIIAKADSGDYVTLPVSRVTRKENLHPVYDVPVDPAKYPALNLTSVSYVRTHKQTVIHADEISGLYGDMKANYEELFLEILEKREQFSCEITDQALSSYDAPIVKKLPADWYDPAEDAEWEEYLK